MKQLRYLQCVECPVNKCKLIYHTPIKSIIHFAYHVGGFARLVEDDFIKLFKNAYEVHSRFIILLRIKGNRLNDVLTVLFVEFQGGNNDRLPSN